MRQRDRSGISWQSTETLLQQGSCLRTRDARDTLGGLVILDYGFWMEENSALGAQF